LEPSMRWRWFKPYPSTASAGVVARRWCSQVLAGPVDGLKPVADTDFLEHIVKMRLHGVFADTQAFGDFHVGGSRAKQPDDLHLPLRQATGRTIGIQLLAPGELDQT